MNFKLFAAVFGVLLAVQASQASPLKDDDLKAVIVAVYTKILSVETEALNKFSDYVQDLENNKSQVQADIVAFITKVANTLNQDIINLLEDLRDGATDDGKAVLDCIDAEQSKTDAAFNKLAADLGVCFVDNTLINTALTELIGQLSALIATAQAEVDTLSSCTSDDTTCLIAFLQTRVADLKDLVTLVKDDVQKAVKLAEDLLDMIVGCVKTEYPVLQSLAQEIFNEGVVCIKA